MPKFKLMSMPLLNDAQWVGILEKLKNHLLSLEGSDAELYTDAQIAIQQLPKEMSDQLLISFCPKSELVSIYWLPIFVKKKQLFLKQSSPEAYRAKEPIRLAVNLSPKGKQNISSSQQELL